MKIALNIEHFDIKRGGAEKYVYELAQEMIKQGHEVYVFTTNSDIPNNSNIVIRIVPTIKITKLISAISFIKNSAQLIKKESFDIVHVFGKNTYMNIFQPLGGSHRGSFVQNLKSLDSVFEKTIRLIGTVFNFKKIYFFFIEYIQIKKNSNLRIIAISKMVKDMFIKHYSFPSENIDVVYNGVDLRTYNPENKVLCRNKIRKTLEIRDDVILLIFVANNFRLKGLHCAIKALAHLEKDNCKLLVVGSDKRKKYLKMAQKLGCSNNLIFAGIQNNVNQYLAAADICFQPTFYDPASLVVLEALASGIPVITTQYNGMGEVITDCKNGFVVDNPCNTSKLVDSIKYYINKTNLENAKINARKIAENYTLENNYKDVLKVYKKI